ncbi:hypothetical protein GCM10009765_35470 [Fodinicola feengrottensis]|uniref:Uncharacterized protein n=1 Tax=Fodinicola feengrottensis TaxID=435914 RepID=A0ABN2H7A6_9ACTN
MTGKRHLESVPEAGVVPVDFGSRRQPSDEVRDDCQLEGTVIPLPFPVDPASVLPDPPADDDTLGDVDLAGGDSTGLV